MATAPDKPSVDTQQVHSSNPSHDHGEPEDLPIVDTPTSPSSAFALSRFEFEADKGKEGTKILMVEWDTSAGGEEDSGTSNWEVSWEGKTTVLPIRDLDTEIDESGTKSRRIYFLLPPGAPIPPLVSITQLSTRPGQKGPPLRTKPMPAIFPAELVSRSDSSGDGKGKKGVLHTIWAKKRLRELQAEIDREMKDNVESVGLEMAMQEQQWIVDQFGLGKVEGAPAPTRLHIPQGPSQGPASPRSPIGGKLGEKLRGLKGLATNPIDLAAAAQGTNANRGLPRSRFVLTNHWTAARTVPKSSQPQFTLSPGASDVAVSSFGSMFPQSQNSTKVIGNGGGGIASLDAIVGSGVRPPPPAEADVEEDLFALPMSPRSPEMKRSPFSLL